MKSYQLLAPMGVFSLGQAVKAIGNESNAKKALSGMLRNNQVRRVKKNLYSIIDPVTQDDSMSRFVIASHVTEDSFVGLHSAFEFYGFYNQTHSDIQVLSTKRFLNFQYGDYFYACREHPRFQSWDERQVFFDESDNLSDSFPFCTSSY